MKPASTLRPDRDAARRSTVAWGSRGDSAAWIAERKDVLSGLCFTLVLLGYERYARHRSPPRYLAVLALLALGLAAKPMLVTVPFVLLLLDLWPLGRTHLARPADGSAWQPAPWAGLLVEKLPLLALSIAASVVTFRAQQAAGAIATLESIPAGARAANATISSALYVLKTICPTALAVYYPFSAAALSWWKISAAGLGKSAPLPAR